MNCFVKYYYCHLKKVEIILIIRGYHNKIIKQTKIKYKMLILKINLPKKQYTQSI